MGTTIVKPKRKKNFVNNADLLQEVIKSKDNFIANPAAGRGQAMTRTLVNMLIVMVDKFAQKRNWGSYSYLDELKQNAILTLCEKWDQYDHVKYSDNPNPFAYYTSIIQNSFRGQVLKEKKPQKIRDAILKSKGYTPSFSQQLDDEANLAYAEVQAEQVTHVEHDSEPDA